MMKGKGHSKGRKGLGFRVSDLGFRVWDCGFRIPGLRVWFWDLGFRILGPPVLG